MPNAQPTRNCAKHIKTAKKIRVYEMPGCGTGNQTILIALTMEKSFRSRAAATEKAA